METFYVFKVSRHIFYCFRMIFLLSLHDKPCKTSRIAKLTYKKILHYFLQGVIILAPIAVTASALYWILKK